MNTLLTFEPLKYSYGRQELVDSVQVENAISNSLSNSLTVLRTLARRVWHLYTGAMQGMVTVPFNFRSAQIGSIYDHILKL
jgi:hypothetical protein